MTNRKTYKTKHSDELIKYFESIPGKHVTAGEICTCMKNNGSSIGTATVYRQLDRLVDDGLIKKYIVDEGSSACYEYVPGGDHLEHENCYHCKCSGCGRLIHMSCHEVEGIIGHISEHHGFRIDPTRTVFYGFCEKCQQVNA